MKSLLFTVLVLLFVHELSAQPPEAGGNNENKELATVFAQYYEEGLRLFPIEATFNGDNRFNDLLFPDFTAGYRATIREYYYHYLYALRGFKREGLNEQQRLSYDILKKDLEIGLEGLTLKDNRFPFSQFDGLPLTMGQLGSGEVGQPFRTVKDYDNWLSRARAFSAWTDSALVYMRKGIAEGMVLPRALVLKMVPQMESFVVDDPAKSVFYGPVNKMPAHFAQKDRERLTAAYKSLIEQHLVPSYEKLAFFLRSEYFPKARASAGLGALPEGDKIYRYNIRYITTTNKTAEELYATGLDEVKRIKGEMEKIRVQLGFAGSLDSLFRYMKTDPRFFPYKTPEEVLAAYRSIRQKVEPHLAKMFSRTPRTPFVVKQTEAFRAASSIEQYFPGSLENERPAIFYVPVLDATRKKVDESIFLHEAIPGHHYQLALQAENESLPKFRRYARSTAYIEGWALYAESLGKELGCYTDPYQYLQALSGEMHRAIRLVTDAGLHAKGWTREQAIAYMMENEPISEHEATSEIERYMAIPGQALAYKVGSMKIRELRERYQKSLGAAFSLAAFHDELLKDGAMPLDILEQKMDAWAKRQKK